MLFVSNDIGNAHVKLSEGNRQAVDLLKRDVPGAVVEANAAGTGRASAWVCGGGGHAVRRALLTEEIEARVSRSDAI
jgi:hypothetical protein